MTDKKNETNKSTEEKHIRLLRTTFVDNVRRARGWQGATAQPLPQNCYVLLSAEKPKPKAQGGK